MTGKLIYSAVIHFRLFSYPMLKKLSIGLLVAMAYAVLLSHSFIPHDHDHDQVLAAQQHHHHDHENDHNQGIGDLFAHFQHYDDKGFALVSADTPDFRLKLSNLVSQTAVGFDIPIHFFSRTRRIPEKPPTYYSPLLITNALRGPPYFV